MKILAKRKSLRVIQDNYGRVILYHRKKLKRDNRRRRGKGAYVKYTKLAVMSKYIVRNFISNIDKLSEELETKEKNQGIGRIMSSLLRPLPEVLGAVCEKQKKDVEALYKEIGWIWEKKI